MGRITGYVRPVTGLWSEVAEGINKIRKGKKESDGVSQKSEPTDNIKENKDEKGDKGDEKLGFEVVLMKFFTRKDTYQDMRLLKFGGLGRSESVDIWIHLPFFSPVPCFRLDHYIILSNKFIIIFRFQ